jgi:formylglycine-generating enzyme required for sulfatase activity
MNNLPREKLRELIVQYGRSLCNDPRRCKALLKDYCGQYKREIFALVSAQDNRVAEELLKASAGVPQSIVLTRLSKRLEDQLGFTKELAHWAVESWALALDVIDQPLPAMPPAAAPPPVFLTALQVFRDRLLDGSDGPAIIVIPAGIFWMGSPKNQPERDDNERRHRVTIPQPFAVGQYPVTFDDYDRFCAATGRDKPNDEGWGRERRPVIHVDGFAAVAYTQWLSQQTGQTYRLPTEAEWEYTARAGARTAFGWGNRITPDQANYDSRQVYASEGQSGIPRQQTTPVGTFPPNPWGLYDTVGNVFEWTGSLYAADYHEAERSGSVKDPTSVRVVRGGSWFYGPAKARSAYRNRRQPFYHDHNLGFRLARLF